MEKFKRNLNQRQVQRKHRNQSKRNFYHLLIQRRFRPRRVIVSESRLSATEENDQEDEVRSKLSSRSFIHLFSFKNMEEDDEEEQEEDDDSFPFAAWLHDHLPIEDSVQLGEHVFGLIVNPTPVKKFMKRIWQREPLLIQRKQDNYYQGLFSTSEIDEILREFTLEYGENIDLTFFNPSTMKKERHNPEGMCLIDQQTFRTKSSVFFY